MTVLRTIDAIVQCLHYYLFEELGKHYPIAGLMQLDHLDPIAPSRNRDKLSQLLSPTQSAKLHVDLKKHYN